ncbi:hypothetical protein HH308_05745 [Gordonia sp. TBRC 11910]|uniref:Uncharacterized protein n=1 Tax=Gordonia asplenii TaxID=2725283 RepID=A0A848KRY3_9ACTN|nr:hypothetical protein [Gordonia asplenii]NMO00717.1 hypothetical protein [Gordonia asplenii]
MNEAPKHEVPQRERVVLAHRRGARIVRTRVEVQEQTEIGDALVRGLMRAQLGLALRLGCSVLAICVAIAVVVATVPAIGAASVFGVRTVWITVGPLLFGVFYGVGRLYLRLADQAEQDFLGVVDEGADR